MAVLAELGARTGYPYTIMRTKPNEGRAGTHEARITAATSQKVLMALFALMFVAGAALKATDETKTSPVPAVVSR